MIATTLEPPPTGNGPEVLPFVLGKAEEMRPDARYAFVCQALQDRAELGKKKYGTYLRAQNGRNPAIDYFQELLDAVMYAGQCLMENKLAGIYFWATLNLTICVAEAIMEKN